VERRDPPGASNINPERSTLIGSGDASFETPSALRAAGKTSANTLSHGTPGSIDDNLPFAPDGTRIASIAWRTWIYTDTGSKRSRYGYLRAGAVVDARGPALKNDGCEGGWYRINPRGFVCVGLGATLDLNHPVVQASSVRPIRGQGLPYVYALSNEPPPLLYFRLPNKDQMREAEGEEVFDRGAAFRERMRVQGYDQIIGDPGAPPDFLSSGQKLVKPYGVKQPLHYAYHAGRANPSSGFAMARTFTWLDRSFGLTTELDIVALDRTKIVRPSEMRGVTLEEGEELPVGFVKERYAQKYKADEAGTRQPAGSYGFREGVKLNGKHSGSVLETRDGHAVAESVLRIVPKREAFPSFATGDRKWVDISIRDQSLVAYVGTRPVYVTLVSTGRGGMADPEKVEEATVRGTFMIYQKEVSSTMDGDEDRSDSVSLHDVPFVQYFHKGYALHGTYWHDEFGKIRSHGCVNLSPTDAAWLFEWTDPSVPPEWHGVLNKERGTVVYVRP
jgi:lipoprotein-anchoring transpeptidase ErfK/SrfK